MNKKIISLLSIALILASCGGSSGSSSEELSSSAASDSSLSQESSISISESLSSEQSISDSSSSSEQIVNEFVTNETSFYIPRQTSSGDFVKSEVTTFEYGYYEDNPCFIYMGMDTALSFFFPDAFTVETSIHYYTYKATNGLEIYIDANKETISIVNFDEVNLFSKEYDVKLGLIDEGHTNQYVRNNGTTYAGGEQVIFYLNRYGLDIIEKDSRPFIPFSVINNLFFINKYYSAVGFNGTAFYLLDLLNGVAGLSGTSNTYMSDYYKGAFRGAKRSKEFIELNYGAFMLQLDTIYGFLDERMTPFNVYLEDNYPEIVEDLHSSSHITYTAAVNRIMEEVIGDGHTNAGNASTAFGTGTVNTPSYTSERSRELNNYATECFYARYNAFGYNVPYIRYKNNTAIVTFDGFYHEPVTFTKSNINQYIDNDGFALFYYVFNELSKKSSIDNVIFDITINGGGDTNALIPMLGFLTRKVETTSYNPLSKFSANLCYEVDTNLDGVYDEKDSYEGKYKYFVLSSGYSFSCANLFAGICKDSGLAKIIGHQSGGGACAVTYTATPDGKPFRISGLTRKGLKDNPAEHDDYGVLIDAEINNVSDYYNDTYLDELVNKL